jgi:hypothetical protein
MLTCCSSLEFKLVERFFIFITKYWLGALDQSIAGCAGALLATRIGNFGVAAKSFREPDAIFSDAEQELAADSVLRGFFPVESCI